MGGSLTRPAGYSDLRPSLRTSRRNQPVGENGAKVYDGDVLCAPHGGARASCGEIDYTVVSLSHDDVDLVLVCYRVVEVSGNGQRHILSGRKRQHSTESEKRIEYRTVREAQQLEEEAQRQRGVRPSRLRVSVSIVSVDTGRDHHPGHDGASMDTGSTRRAHRVVARTREEFSEMMLHY